MSHQDHTALYEESHLAVLRLLEQNPNLSQRELAEALGISVGKINRCVKNLVEHKLITRSGIGETGYMHFLTKEGQKLKLQLMNHILERKIKNISVLEEEVEKLKYEIR